MRCYVLGAGFSVGAGFPLGRDLLKRTEHDALELKTAGFHSSAPWSLFTNWWKMAAPWLPAFFATHPDLDGVDVELLFTLMDLQARQRDGPGLALREARRALREALYGLFDALDAKVSGNLPPYIQAFGHLAAEGDACLVLNYDLLAERGLLAAGRWHVDDGWGFAIQIERTLGGGLDEIPPHAPSVPVLKLHGSHGWRERYDGTLGMEIEVLQRFGTTIQRAPGFSLEPDNYVDKEHAILEPSYLKATDSGALRPVWREASRVLQQTNEWIVCGYSFPDADAAARTMFLLAAAGSAPRRTTIVDPDRRVAERVCRLIGSHVYHLDRTAESWIVDLAGDLSEAKVVNPVYRRTS